MDLPKKSKGPPDAGWSWVVLIGIFIVCSLIFGLAKTGGIMYTAISMNFDVSRATAAAIPNTSTGTMFLIGPIVGVLCKYFSSRQLIMAGGIITSVGLTVSAFATSVPMLMGGYGVLLGIGFGLTQIPTKLILVDYFEARRSLAISLSFAGSCVGAIIFPPIVEYLLEMYSVRGMWLLLGGMLLHVAACGALCRPIKRNRALQTKQKSNQMEIATVQQESNGSIPTKENIENEFHLTTAKYKRTNSTMPDIVINTSTTPITDSEPPFPIQKLFFICLSAVLQAATFSIFKLITPDHAETFLAGNITRKESAFLLSLVAGSEMGGKLLTGFIVDRKYVSLEIIFSFNSVILCLLSFTLTHLVTYSTFLACCVMLGIVIGSLGILPTLMVNAYMTPSQMRIAYSFTCIVVGIPFLVLAPIIGTIRDRTGSYLACYYLQSLLSFCMAIIWLIDAVIGRASKRKTYHVQRAQLFSDRLRESITMTL